MLRIIGALIIGALMWMPSGSGLAQGVSKEQIKGLDEQVQEIKGDVLGITAELKRLEEKLLYPSNTQVSVFVSIAEGEEFRLDAVAVELDGKPVANHIYRFKELEALRKGGVQRIHTGNIRTGEHKLKVKVVGQSSTGRDYRKTSSFTITKEVGPKLVGIVLAGPGKGGGSIVVEDW